MVKKTNKLIKIDPTEIIAVVNNYKKAIDGN